MKAIFVKRWGFKLGMIEQNQAAKSKWLKGYQQPKQDKMQPNQLVITVEGGQIHKKAEGRLQVLRMSAVWIFWVYVSDPKC